MSANLPAPVRLHGVVKAFGGRRVLDGVDLDVEAGALLALVGSSGAGKSTILRLVAGLADPDAGRIEVGGTVVADPRSRVPPERRGVGMVFQGLELWPHMTAAENVAFGLPGRPRGSRALAHPRVRELAGAVGIEDCLGRRPPTLSGGERQRVAIARALAPGPSVLLYDEPLANLDPDRRSEVRRLVRGLRATHPSTIVYVTHDASEALEMGDQVAVLDGGRIVRRGPPIEVYRRPDAAAAARALGAVSFVPARVRPGPVPRVETPLGEFDAGPLPEDASAVALRPEQVVASEGGSGAPARVVDVYPLGPDWAFVARLDAGGARVLGRSASPLVPGAAVRLSVRGVPAPVSGAPERRAE